MGITDAVDVDPFETGDIFEFSGEDVLIQNGGFEPPCKHFKDFTFNILESVVHTESRAPIYFKNCKKSCDKECFLTEGILVNMGCPPKKVFIATKKVLDLC